MDSLKRIYLACRASIAELAPVTYLISPGILLICAISIFFSSGDRDSDKGVLSNAYLVLDPEFIFALAISIGWLAATIISGTIVNKYFKEENQGIHFLSMPLSNPERFAASFTINWVFVSVVSFLPLFLICLIGYYLRPDNVLMVSPMVNARWFLLGPLAHLITLAFWLFPSVAYAKKAGYAIAGIIVAAIVYTTQTRGRFSNSIGLEQDSSVFDATDVVGLHHFGAFNGEVAAAFELPDPEIAQLLCLAIVMGLMIFSAYIAFTRKTT